MLCDFVACLADVSLQQHTIKTNLSGSRYFQISAGLVDPFQLPMLRLDYVLKGIKRVQVGNASRSRVRLPITLSILQKLKAVCI